MDKYQKKFKEFKENMQGCILQVWQELNSEQKEMAEEIIMQAWEEEDTQGFRYSDQQLLACFLSNQILYPCSDAVFKAIFLNDEGYVLLKDLICWTIFQGQKKILDLTVLPSEQNISVFGDKIFHCDILVVLENNEKCNIEMQLTHHEGLSSRMVIQAAKLHVSQAKKGLEFLSIKPTLSLWIMPFDFTGFQDCYSSARLRFDQDSAKIMSDDMQFHFFEFSKALAHPEKEGLGLWRSFFGMKTIEDYNSLQRKGDIMSRATSNLASLSINSAFRQNVVEESFKELGRRIERGAYYEKGLKEGKIEGIKEGETKGKIEGLGLLLQVRFGEVGLQLIPKIRTIQDLDKLNSLLPLAVNAQNIQELEHGLAFFLPVTK